MPSLCVSRGPRRSVCASLGSAPAFVPYDRLGPAPDPQAGIDRSIPLRIQQRPRCYANERRRIGDRVSAAMAPQRHGGRAEFLITVKADVVDAHFAGLNTIHYLRKVLVFDLQSVAD